jgi:hypothetical protein
VRTRTLLLLAVVCGLAILVAGVVQLLRVAAQDEPPRPALVGERVRVGDMDVVVTAAEERNARMLVDIELGGVDDPDGAAGFSLITSSGALTADPTAGNHCGATTVAPQPCTLAFRLGGDAGTSRVLVYRRGEEQVRWDLGAD